MHARVASSVPLNCTYTPYIVYAEVAQVERSCVTLSANGKQTGRVRRGGQVSAPQQQAKRPATWEPGSTRGQCPPQGHEQQLQQEGKHGRLLRRMQQTEALTMLGMVPVRVAP